MSYEIGDLAIDISDFQLLRAGELRGNMEMGNLGGLTTI